MSHFFAMMSRMKYIQRWALMRNSYPENISEHSLEVGLLAHALAVIGNRRLGRRYAAERAALIGLYHDCTEILTGDMPTPIKYYNRDTKDAFKHVEHEAAEQLLGLLPQDLRGDYESLFFVQEGEEELFRLAKAADRISALIKCMEEEKTGNREFVSARASIEQRLHAMELPEVEIFCREFLPAYEKTLDELKG